MTEELPADRFLMWLAWTVSFFLVGWWQPIITTGFKACSTLAPESAYLAVYATAFLCAYLAANGPAQLIVSRCISPTMVLIPFLVTDPTQKWGRGIVSIASIYYSVRLYEVQTLGRLQQETLVLRFGHIGFSFHDIGLRNPGKRADCIPVFCLLVLDVAFVGTALFMIFSAQQFLGVVRAVLLVLGGCVYALFSLKAFGRSIAFCFLAIAELELPTLMDDPEWSLSLREFWGIRWNTVIQSLLKQYVYKPLRRQGVAPAASGFATFVASGVLHVYPLWVAGLSNLATVSMMGYFVVQALLMAIEGSYIPAVASTGAGGSKAAAIDSKPLWTFPMLLRRTWVLSAVVIPSPLFFGPVFALSGIGLLE
jgi:hypothetical protein